MRGADEVRDLDAEALVRLAIDDAGAFEAVYLELLEHRAPSHDVAAVLVEAWARRRAPAWLVAALLGACRSPGGAEACLAILEGGHRFLSEGNAGVALARIRGAEARADLRRVVLAGRTLAIREGALAGLMQVGVGDDRVAFLATLADDRRARAEVVGAHLARDPFADEDALAWLAGEGLWHRHVILRRAIDGTHPTASAPSKKLAAAVLRAMDEGRLFENAQYRARLAAVCR